MLVCKDVQAVHSICKMANACLQQVSRPIIVVITTHIHSLLPRVCSAPYAASGCHTVRTLSVVQTGLPSDGSDRHTLYCLTHHTHLPTPLLSPLIARSRHSLAFFHTSPWQLDPNKKAVVEKAVDGLKEKKNKSQSDQVGGVSRGGDVIPLRSRSRCPQSRPGLL